MNYEDITIAKIRRERAHELIEECVKLGFPKHYVYYQLSKRLKLHGSKTHFSMMRTKEATAKGIEALEEVRAYLGGIQSEQMRAVEKILTKKENIRKEAIRQTKHKERKTEERNFKKILPLAEQRKAFEELRRRKLPWYKRIFHTP